MLGFPVTLNSDKTLFTVVESIKACSFSCYSDDQ